MALFSKNFKMSSSSFYMLICATACFYSQLQLSIAGNNETDRQALLEIKAKISHDPLAVLSSWNDSFHFCEWHGVFCGHRHQRVTRLDLASSKLAGSLSPHIGNLSFLRGLYLQNNSLDGTIPPEIGHLLRLQYLYLDNNTFGGPIPSNISGCSGLIELDVGRNRLIGGIPPELGFFSYLRYLSLDNNNLTGTLPSSLGNLSSLAELDIPDNNLIGMIPESLGKLKNLTFFALGANKLSGKVPPSIFNLSLLTTLELRDNNLEGKLPSGLGIMLPYLQWFSISFNRFTGSIPASISNASNLEVLLLTSNNLHGQVPSMQKLERLTRLTLFNNSLGNGRAGDLNFVSSLANATKLQFFGISQNNFKGTFPRTICNFSMLMGLRFDDNKIDGHIPTCIENLIHLETFVTVSNQLSGIIPEGIGKLHNLVNLDLGDNQFVGNIPSSFGNLTKLTFLLLSENNLQGQIPSSLENYKSLLYLDLSKNNLSGRIPFQLLTLSSLSHGLYLSYNHLTGPLPVEVGRLNNLGVLDISENMLSGEIPSALGACVALESLKLEGNSFQGVIPDALKTLKGLVVLDLSRNNLSGKIPKFLVNIRFQVLNVSYNNLEGEVPTDGVFSNATGVSIFGNSRLCGGIHELKLPKCNFDEMHTRKPRHRRRLILAILCGLLGVILLVAFVSLYIFWYKKGTKEPTTSGDSENFPNLSYQSLLKATEGFSSKNLIGNGAFGVVYKGTLDENRTKVAIKIFNLDHHGASSSFMAECGVLRNIRHRNLLKVITACSSVDYQGKDFKALVYEFMENGSLEGWLHPGEQINRVPHANYTPRSLNICQRLDIAVDIAFALEYLHHHCGSSVVHCDLKPSNVLLDGEMVAHVGDFGLAKFLSTSISASHANQSSSVAIRGTIGYTPPEYGLGNEVSTYGDVYSFGILLLEMFTGKRPTSEMFKEGVSLHQFVRAAMPEQVIEIIDRALLEDIVTEETNRSMVLETLISGLEIALSCSVELPQERSDMSDVAVQLSSIRNKVLGTRFPAGIQG